MINNVLREYLNDFVIIYLNNIFVYLFILKYLNKRDLRVKSKKYVFYKKINRFFKIHYRTKRNTYRLNQISNNQKLININ